MADPTSPNPSAPQANIDDLVKELSRPQGSPPASTPTPSAVPPAMASRPMLSPTMPANPVPAIPKPATSAPAPVAPSAPKEYQSSIRTMTDDLSKLKAGQQPQGVNVPRKVDTTPPPSTKPTMPATPAPAPAKPMPSSSMPSAVKSAPLPSISAPKAPAPSPAPVPIPRPTMPSAVPSAKALETKLDQKNQFYVPPTGTGAKPAGGGSRNTLIFAGIGVLVVLLGGLFWYVMIYSGGGSPLATESPIETLTPRPTATPVPSLEDIFPTKSGVISLPISGDPAKVFNTALATQIINPGLLGTLSVNISTASGSALGAPGVFELFDRFSVHYPVEIKPNLGSKYLILVYGQKETFDTKGKITVSTTPSNRLVIISEMTAPASYLMAWEPTIDNATSGLSKLLNINPAKNKKAFEDNNYQGVVIRFKNYPYADHSLDYAQVQFGGKTYLIIANSREAMFATIDAFMGTVQGK